jgi:thymidine kinase
MFAGKSTTLIREKEAAIKEGLKVAAFKHAWDDRYSKTEITTHNNESSAAVATKNPTDILKDGMEADVVIIDEAQFYDPNLVRVIAKLRAAGKRVVVGGLDQDFKREGFGIMPELMAQATTVNKLTATCAVCGCKRATLSQRLVNGNAAEYTDPVVMVGAEELYEPRCPKCHNLPGAPEPAER